CPDGLARHRDEVEGESRLDHVVGQLLEQRRRQALVLSRGQVLACQYPSTPGSVGSAFVDAGAFHRCAPRCGDAWSAHVLLLNVGAEAELAHRPRVAIVAAPSRAARAKRTNVKTADRPP